MNDRRLWTSDQDAIITDLVQEHGCKKWTTIASQMTKTFGHQSRTSKQIRQRWYNHLDPQINKSEWTEQQERIIFQAHRLHGSKWKQIAKMLHSRTDNSVKNHFYSTLRRSLRRINKYLGFKNSTNQMRIIKPSILSQLVESAQTNKQARMLVDRIFEFSAFKPSKCNTTDKVMSLEGKDKAKYMSAIQKLVQYNNLYQFNKKQMKKKALSKPTKTVSRSKKSNKSKNILGSVSTTISLPQIKIQQIQQEYFPQTINFHQSAYQIYQKQSQHPQNVQTLSDRNNSSWSREFQEQNMMLPQIQKPDDEFDFFGCQISSQMNPFNLMIHGHQITVKSQCISNENERKTGFWLQNHIQRIEETNNRNSQQLITNFIFNQPLYPFQDI